MHLLEVESDKATFKLIYSKVTHFKFSATSEFLLPLSLSLSLKSFAFWPITEKNHCCFFGSAPIRLDVRKNLSTNRGKREKSANNSLDFHFPLPFTQFSHKHINLHVSIPYSLRNKN
jgi:hypothetical protein